MPEVHRSLCPINLSLELFGDKWTLLIIRDLVFARKRHFREFLQSGERISSNILADRLNMLLEEGFVTKRGDLSHKQKAIYSLTEKGIDLVPVLAQIGIWGSKYRPVTEESAETAAMLEEGGSELIEEIKSELRQQHLGLRTVAG